MKIDINGSAKVSGFEALAIVGLMLLASIPAVLFRAWSAQVIWGWFMLPAGADAVPFAAFVGLIVLVTLIRPAKPKQSDGASAWLKLGELLAEAFLMPLFVLGFAWVISAIVL